MESPIPEETPKQTTLVQSNKTGEFKILQEVKKVESRAFQLDYIEFRCITSHHIVRTKRIEHSTMPCVSAWCNDHV